MQTLSYGFILPQTNDKGTALWTALQNNISQLNNHSHNGTDSALITGNHISSSSQSIPAASWVTYTGAPTGFYRQLVTMAAGYTWAANSVTFRDAAGNYVYPTVVNNDATSFYIYTNDNTQSFTAIYGG